MSARLCGALAVALAVLLVAACAEPLVGFGQRCAGDDDCLAGYACDPVARLCIRAPAEDAGAEGEGEAGEDEGEGEGEGE